MKVRIAIAVLLAALVGTAGSGVPAAQQLPLFDLLVTTASIVFGVSGAWIALVHRTEMTSANAQSGRFRNLIRSMIASGVTIAVVLLVRGLHALAASKTWIPEAAFPWLQGVGFGTWFFLFLVLLWSLFAMLPSALYAKGEIENRKRHQKVLASLPPKLNPDKREQSR